MGFIKGDFRFLELLRYSVGRSGGLALFWHHDVDVTVISLSKSHIDVEVCTYKVFRLTLLYGNPRVEKRKESWDLLRR